MGFYIRRAVSFGPLRFNLSKGGVGVSVGVKGARIGSGPGGAYVHMGRDGLYYRQRLGTSDPPNAPPAIHPASPAPESTTAPDASGLVDSSSQEVLSQLNARISQAAAAPVVFSLTVVVLTVAAFFNGVVASCVGVLGLGLTWLFHNGDKHKRTSELFYHLADSAAQRFTALQTACETLAKSHRVWLVGREQLTWDGKQNAGAWSLLSRSTVSVGLGEAPWIRTNLRVWSIDLGTLKLYFFPDRILFWDSRKYGAVSYESLTVTFAPTRFIEAGAVPGDAEVVDYTWQHLNKDGSADRRFRSNRRLPIALYGSLAFTSQTGMNVLLHVSSRQIAAQFAGVFAVDIRGVAVKAAIPSDPQKGNNDKSEMGSRAVNKARNWEDSPHAVERGDLPVVDISGELLHMEADEVCHLVIPHCRFGHQMGKLFITSKRISSGYELRWLQWPLKYVISCRIEESDIVLNSSNRRDAARLSTGNPAYDSLVVTLIQKLISMRGADPAQPKSGHPDEEDYPSSNSKRSEPEKKPEADGAGSRPKADGPDKPTAAVVSLAANHLRSAFPKTAFEVYIDHIRVIHVGWAGTPHTAEVRSSLRALVLKGQIPNVEFDFQHTDPEDPQESRSPQGTAAVVSLVESYLRSLRPETTFEVYSRSDVVHVAWRGAPQTDAVRHFLRQHLGDHGVWADLNFHHDDPEKSSGSSASGGKSRAESRPQAKAVSQKGPYEILGVSPSATLDEISQAWRREAQQNHPDKVATMAPEFRELAEKRMKELNAAYEELKSRVK